MAEAVEKSDVGRVIVWLIVVRRLLGVGSTGDDPWAVRWDRGFCLIVMRCTACRPVAERLKDRLWLRLSKNSVPRLIGAEL